MKPAAYKKTTKNLFAFSVLIIAALFTAYLIETRGYAFNDNGVSPEASTIVVNSVSDAANPSDGLCTLREAISAANNNTPSGEMPGECPAGNANDPDVITLPLSDPIDLIAALPDINSDMSIVGPGATQLIIRRKPGTYSDFNTSRIFTIASGIVSLSGVTVANGQPPLGSGGGGGILNLATLTLTGVAVVSNSTAVRYNGPEGGGDGGGILNKGILTMTNCAVQGNFTNGGYDGGDGGGLYNSGTLNMTNCVVNGNSSAQSRRFYRFYGGGIFNSGTMTLTNTTISNNHTGPANDYDFIAPPGDGAGIYNVGQNASLVNCTVIGNTTGDSLGLRGIGGGISNGAPLTIVGTTISGNVGKDGSGIYNGSTLILSNSTISGNNCTPTSACGFASGIYNRSGASATLVNSTIAASQGVGVYDSGNPSSFLNTIVAANVGGDVNGQVTSLGHNLIGNSSGSTGFTNGVNGDQVGSTASPLNPQLSPLANNGGPTQTHALLSNSPALDAGDNCVTQAAHCNNAQIPILTTEQRGSGFSRLVDGPDLDATATVDIGAYEMQTPLANLTDQSTNEDTQLLVPFDVGDPSTITAVSASSSDPNVVPNDAAHLSAAINGATGVVTINPAANASGATNITVTVNRTGGPESKTFLLTVNSANDAPSFTKGADQTVNEDAGAQTVSGWATGISPGPANESAQTVTFMVSNSNNALFSSQPALSANGTLTYALAANANGSANVAVIAKDDGGTANGGSDISASQGFTITVNSVNDAPSFTKGADQSVNNNAGAQTVAGWATNVSTGAANESGQTLNFQVTNNTNPNLFTAGPAISSAGTLTYTPLASGGGTAIITIVLRDNGGTSNGGVDTSLPQTLSITVTPVGGFVSFTTSGVSTAENSGSITLNVTRSGDTSKTVTVNYATNADMGVPCSTPSGVASPKCDFTATLGILSFAAGETSKTITVLISQDSFVEGPEAITLTLWNPTGGAALGTTASMSVMISDDVTEPPGNVIDNANMFVRMHYHDFLNREGDQSGLDFWTGQMTNCGASDPLVCRVNVSGAFFLSIEFQQTGYLVERMYKIAYGDSTSTSNLGGSHVVLVPIVRADEFLADTQRLGRGVVVLQPGWDTVLENNKRAYALEFVQTPRFITALPISLTPAQFVDKLNQNAGMVLSPGERATAINAFGIAVDTTNINARAQVVRQIAEDQDLYNAEFSRAFVLAQYIGYLRRSPSDAPEPTLDYTGYEFWLTKLNQFNGDYIKAEMVKAFIASDEYRKRFGP